MKKMTICFLASIIFFSFTCWQALAIGQWHEGIVTKAAWVNKYLYIQINNVRYTIMKDAKIVTVYEEKGASYRESISIDAIVNGSRLFYKNEGNRIYEIEKIR